MKKLLRNERGMVDILLAVLVIAVLAVGGYAVYVHRLNQGKKVDATTTVTSNKKSSTKHGSGSSMTNQTVAQGSISGTLGYPASDTPAMSVCAQSISDSATKVCADTPEGAKTYSLTVKPGSYNVYASLKTQQGDFKTTYKAYYNKYVTCGEQASCASALHTQYIEVIVTAGKDTLNVNPTDWYAL